MKPITENELIERGNNLIELLQLKIKNNGRVDTIWGDKTPLGLYHTVSRVINEGSKS
jgi:hypothetical protein